MDHSIYGYLCRRSTEELQMLQKHYASPEASEYEKQVLKMILDILSDRAQKRS